ncbi:MAG: LacI family DNA-binding transcriptional regulator [Pseudomonadota bacterium]
MSKQKIRNMEEFAKISGISRPTVSKYFNDPESVRASTRERIEQAIQAHDYRPNIFAINQNRRSTKNIGIVVPYLADPFFAEIARRLEQQCIDAGYSPILFSSHGVPEHEAEILQSLISLKPAGVLFAPLGRSSNRSEIEAFCAQVPTILFDSNIEGMGEAFVGSDNFSFVSLTVDYLVRTGEPPCLFEMRTPANPNANKRRAAYLEVMDRYGAESNVISIEGEGWEFEEVGHRGAMRILETGGFPRGTILCSNDRLAIGLLSAFYKKGIRVGRGEGCAVRVASMDDHPFSQFTCPSLTTAAHDYDQVASKAFNSLRDLIDAGGRFNKRMETLFSAQLILRSSA